MKTNNATTILTGILLINTTINIIGGVHDIPSSSFLFSITTIAIGIGLLCIFTRQRLLFKFTYIDLFVATLTLSYFISHFPFSDIRDTGGGSLLFIYWCIRYTRKLNYSLIFYFVLISTTLLVITCYLQYIGLTTSNNPYFRITGPYRNPAICAGVLSMLMSVLVVWLIYPHYYIRYRTIRILIITLLSAGIPVLIITACRSAWLAFIIMFISSIWNYYHQLKKAPVRHHSPKNIKYWLAGTILFFSFIYGMYQLRPISANGRLLIWKVTAQMIQDRPLTGFGAGGFKQHYMHYQATYLKARGTEQEKYIAGNNHLVYNEPLRMTVEYGVLGMIIYIWFIYILFKVPVHTTIVSASARAILITGTVWGLFSYPNEAFPILAILLIAISCLSGHDKNILHIIYPTAYIHKGFKIIVTAITFGLGGILFNQYKAYHTFYNIYQSTTSSNLESFIYHCSTLENNLKHEAFFWMYYCDTLNKMKYDRTLQCKIRNWERLYPSPDTYIIKAESQERIGQEKEAEKLYWLAHFMIPSRQKARSKLAILYKKQGKMKEALELANEILTEKVKNYSFETYRIHTTLERIFENQIK